MKTFQIVGYKNSGKTTAVTRLTELLTKKSQNVVTLKHHHLHEEPTINDGKKDTDKHRLSGSQMSALVGPHHANFEYSAEPPLEAWVAFYKTLPDVDYLLIEGFKKADYPKAVFLRSDEDWKTLKQLTNIIAIIVSEDSDLRNPIDTPIFSKQEEAQYIPFILNFLEV